MNRLRALRAIVRRRIHSIIDVLSVTTPLTLEGSFLDGVDYYYNNTTTEIQTTPTWTFIGTGQPDNTLDYTPVHYFINNIVIPSDIILNQAFDITGDAVTPNNELLVEAFSPYLGTWVAIDTVPVTAGSFTVSGILLSDVYFDSNVPVLFRFTDTGQSFYSVEESGFIIPYLTILTPAAMSEVPTGTPITIAGETYRPKVRIIIQGVEYIEYIEDVVDNAFSIEHSFGVEGFYDIRVEDFDDPMIYDEITIYAKDFSILYPTDWTVLYADKPFNVLTGEFSGTGSVFLEYRSGNSNLLKPGFSLKIGDIEYGDSSVMIPSGAIGFGATEINGAQVYDTDLANLRISIGSANYIIPVVVSTGLGLILANQTHQVSLVDKDEESLILANQTHQVSLVDKDEESFIFGNNSANVVKEE